MTYNNDKKLDHSNARYDVTIKQPSTLLALVDTGIENDVRWLKKGPLKSNKTPDLVQTGGSFYSIAVLKK